MNDLHNRWIEGLAPEHSAQIYASCSTLPIFPLFAALRDHGIPLFFATRGCAITRPRPGLRSRWICILGDDDEISLGPDSFHAGSLRWLAHDASHLMVYSGGAETRFYAMMAAAAALGGRVLVAETQLSHAAAWCSALAALAPRASMIEIVGGEPTGLPSEQSGHA
ncbi:MAG TPA: hypothetical protein VMA86_06090 [Acetobacteraceae bacterium]|nr:hypothetical protein [Acetobacteraceae bacterium]